MSAVFSKNKEKRSRSSSSEANSSFVKNVTSRVSGLLPATIAKWFSSPSSLNTNGSAQAADGTDSSSEDEVPESPIIAQPPSKRMKFSSPGKYNNFSTADANCVPTNIDTIEQCTPYSTVQSPPGRTTFRRETNFVSTPIRALNESTVTERGERDNSLLKSQHTISSVGSSVASKRKSLFNSERQKEESLRSLRITANNKYVDPKAPRFRPSLFGSSFYPGQTMYGGKSVYINQPNVKHSKVTLINESNSSDSSTTMSQSARRVMDLLENYSSPLAEARRISQFLKSSKSEDLDSSTIKGSPYVNKVLSYKTQELHVPNIANLLKLKQRSRLMDTTNAARQIIASHSSSIPDYNCQPYISLKSQKEQQEKESKLTTKVKARVTRQNRGDSIDVEEPVMPVNLPTAVLQIDKDNLPKFTFGSVAPATSSTSNAAPKFTLTSSSSFGMPSSNLGMPPSSTSIRPATMQSATSFGTHANANNGGLTPSKPETVSHKNDPFKFSSPVRITSESHKTTSTPPKFTFGSPEKGVDKSKTDNKEASDSSVVVGVPNEIEKLPIPQLKDWQCPDCWVNNKPDIQTCVCCGAKQPSRQTNKPKCIICKLADSQAKSEKCINCENIQLNNNTNVPALKPMESTNWKCNDCWVSNKETDDKCVCCGAKNLKQNAKPGNVEGEWKCDDCWIKNVGSVDKCVACGGARPGVKKSSISAPKNDLGSSMFRLQDKNMKNIAKTQSDKWECTSCLVRNENNRTKCACCESDKPGLVKESDKKSFNFGMTTNTTFKFGIDPNANKEATATKTSEGKTPESIFKPDESETNNNTLPKAPSFSFGIPAKKVDDQTVTAKENKSVDSKVNESAKTGFTFGLPKQPSKTDVSVTPVFGSTTKLAETVNEKPSEEKEKPQEVPKVDFQFPVSKESSKSVMGIFGNPLGAQLNKEKPLVASQPLLANSLGLEKKDLTNTSSSIVPAIAGSEPQKSTFTFSGIKPATNLFATTSSTASSFSSTIQTPPSKSTGVSLFSKQESTTTATALPLFPKSAPSTTSTTLFQNTTTTTTAAPASINATAPIFSFGGNTTQSVTPQQSEKPKFNFTFGNTPSLFGGNTFSSSTDNNANSTKFTITSNNIGGGNSAGGNNLSAGNSLGGGTSLVPNKSGTTHEIPSNPLASKNDLSSGSNLFGAPTQKENPWSARNNNSTNLFVTNATTNPIQKPAAFTFGSSTPFNATSTAPGFGSNAAPAQNMFGMNQNTSTQPSMFSSPAQTQATPALFGSSQPATVPSMFGTPTVAATPTFGTTNPSIPSFEAPPINSTPAPAFNFGASQSTGIFGFGQQQAQPQSQMQPQMSQPQMPQQAGVYSFGGSPGGPQMQFNMGSAPNTAVRRVRKAVRRNTPR